MRPADDINKSIKKWQLKASADLDKRVHDGISEVLAESEKTESAVLQPNIWRTIMKSPITKLAAAAIIIVAIGLLINFWGNSVAYALDQTIEANHTVRYLNVSYADAKHENDPKEFWIECDETGQIKNADFKCLALGITCRKTIACRRR